MTVPVSLNNMPHHVTTNLGLALRFMRLEDKERIMWVDALCINQADIPEKNHQVRQMRDIYLGAQWVVAWLGEERDILTAVDFCEDLPPRGVVLRAGEIVADQAQLDAYNDLLIHRPYWKRMWVIQELYHGNSVLFQAGWVCIDLEVLYDMAFRYKYFSFVQNWADDRYLHFSPLRWRRFISSRRLTPLDRNLMRGRKPIQLHICLNCCTSFEDNWLAIRGTKCLPCLEFPAENVTWRQTTTCRDAMRTYLQPTTLENLMVSSHHG